MSLSQFERVETNLRNLARRVPDLPVTESLILRAASILGRDITAMLDRLLKPYDLAEPEFRLLMALSSHGGNANAGDVCAALAQSPANLTRIGDALVQRGYISRQLDAADRRRMQLSLEPAGEQLLRELLPGMRPAVTTTFEGFSAEEMAQLLAGLKRLLATVNAVAPADAAE